MLKKIGELLPRSEATKAVFCNRPKFNANRLYSLFEEYYRALVEESGVDFILNEKDKKILGQICLWYAADSRFKGSLRKGLLIHGSYGTGKTKMCQTLEHVMHTVENKFLKIVSAYDLQRIYERQLDEEIEILRKRELLVIDDIGVESVETRYYGNTSEPFKDLFYYRYQENKTTIITTNLTHKELKERYGDRIYDRMIEVLNDIVLDGKSKRK